MNLKSIYDKNLFSLVLSNFNKKNKQWRAIFEYLETNSNYRSLNGYKSNLKKVKLLDSEEIDSLIPSVNSKFTCNKIFKELNENKNNSFSYVDTDFNIKIISFDRKRKYQKFCNFRRNLHS